ncbi:MAG: 1-deoxy-D-xylulose-5-phosphate reductoisomerase [Thermodesulfobacteriota bacterium]
MKGLSILGSTGSIGLSTLEVVRKNPERFKVISLAAGENAELLEAQIKEFKPAFVSLSSEEAAEALKKKVDVEVGSGEEGAILVASYDGVDLCVSAISGAAGLIPTLSAIRAGVDIALANKETLAVAGEIVMSEARARNVNIFPIDSEHSAVFQALLGHRRDDVERIILTASGGPFINYSVEELSGVTPADALNHPNWDMGKKITIDSSTLLNKGLEVIEARWLFDLPAEKISVLIHTQSIVHSMVEYVDGSIVAQMGTPDMKGPIGYALSYPERIDGVTERLDLTKGTLDFEEPDLERFPCLGLAYRALEEEGTMPAVLNAADEVAVEAFLEGRIPYTGIFETLNSVMEAHSVVGSPTLEDILDADIWARSVASELLSANLAI